MDVTGNGFTYVDSTSSTFAGGVVRVVYDLNQCNFAGIVAFDITGKRITTPIRSFSTTSCRMLSVQLRMLRTPSTTKSRAEKDENVMRSELGLCLRDVNNHGGDCGPPADDCGGSDGDPGVDCFIVTATTGSPASVEVNRLRQLRDRVVAASGLSADSSM